jgi:hypothetical protein
MHACAAGSERARSRKPSAGKPEHRNVSAFEFRDRNHPIASNP